MIIKRPVGITIISVLMILNGSFLLFSGIVTFILASNFAAHFDTFDLSPFILSETNNTNFSSNDPNLIKNVNYLIYFIAIIITLFSLIHLVIAYGLLKGKSWARSTTLIISFMSTIGNILLILIMLSWFPIAGSISSTHSIFIGNILTIIINTLIIYYLFRKEVKDYFKFMSSQRSSCTSSFDDLR